MNTLIFALPGNEALAQALSQQTGFPAGSAEIRHFPDGETYVRLLTDVQQQRVLVLATLFQPDAQMMALYYLCRILRDSGAQEITLIAPYLAYMRQDKQFHPGEAVTSAYFAEWVSQFADRLITIDPHLHRRKSMSEIYRIPCTVLHAEEIIAEWVTKNVELPLLIGPDSESEQWVSAIANRMSIPYIVLEKTRLGDKNVEISVPDVSAYLQHTPVLMDDIISTARTMIQTHLHLQKAGLQPTVCIGVHGLFAGDALQALQDAGVGKIITCNTIPHATNAIDISPLIVKQL